MPRHSRCAKIRVIGAIFYVMELAKGRPYADGALPDFDPATRRRMYEQMIDTLADLHEIDPDAAGSAISANRAIISSGRSRAGPGSIATARPIICRRSSG